MVPGPEPSTKDAMSLRVLDFRGSDQEGGCGEDELEAVESEESDSLSSETESDDASDMEADLVNETDAGKGIKLADCYNLILSILRLLFYLLTLI